MNKSRRLLRSILAGTAATLMIAVLSVEAVSAAPVSNKEEVNPGRKVSMAISESWQKRPGDYLAAENAAIRAGGDPIRVTFAGTDRRFTAQEAQAIVKGDRKDLIPFAVPIDAFSVSAIWGGASGGPTRDKYTMFIGMWDFRDDFVNGSAPDDISAIGVDYPSCFQFSGDYVIASDYQNVDHSNLAWRQSSSANSNVWGVRDTTSGFKLLTDHGTHVVELKNPNGVCDPYKVKGSYTYEHNQDGNGGWSASVNLGIFSVSYSGNPGSTLRRGTPYGAFH